MAYKITSMFSPAIYVWIRLLAKIKKYFVGRDDNHFDNLYVSKVLISAVGWDTLDAPKKNLYTSCG